MFSLQSFKTLLPCLTFIFCFTHHSFAQSYLLSSLPAEKELSSQQVTCFFQDSKGFMWIGTEDGLNLYNANSIKIFKHDIKNKNSLPDNFVQAICEDGEGYIWVSLATGVSRLNTQTLRFQNFSGDTGKNSFGYKCKIFTDTKKNIWVAGDGLFKFDKPSQQFQHIENTYSNAIHGSRNANRLTGFCEDSKGRYWISTFDGLFLYHDENRSFTRFDTAPTDDNYKKFGIIFLPVQEDSAGNLWVGTWTYGMFKILPGEKKLQAVEKGGVHLVYASQQLNHTDLLWYSGDGLTSLDKTNGRTEKVVHENDNPYSLRNDGISALYTDRQDQLWIGYASQGVQLLSPGNQLIKKYDLQIPGPKKDQVGSVNAILQQNDGFFIGGWYKAALVRVDKDFHIKKSWQHLPENLSQAPSNVSDMYADKKGCLWISTFNGLVCLDEKKETTRLFRFDSSVSGNNRFLDILPEGDSVLWLSGYNNGLARFSMNTHQFELFGTAPRPIVWKIASDKNDMIWCASNSGNLLRFDKQKKNFTTVSFDTLTEASTYYDLTYDSSQHVLWVASSNGLLKVQLADLKARLFTEKEGLPTNSINVLEWGSHQQLWIGSNRGLSLFNPDKNSFRNFYTHNGLATDIIDHRLYMDPQGKLFIGGDSYVMMINTLLLNDKTEKTRAYITAITESDSLLQPMMKGGKKTVELSYYRNNLSFDFAMPDYINSGDNQLLYMLEGWDKDFLLTKKGVINYNKLPPGEYVFRVKGIDHAGIKTEEEDIITIIIHPPFWKTGWFVSLVAVAVLTVFIFVIRYISQRNLKEKLLRLEKEQAVEKERNRISRDMHDDLGSGLTKIAILSEVAKRQLPEPLKAKEQLENISASSRELVDNLQDIIWVLNPKNDTLDNLAAYIREYALKFFEPFQTTLTFNFPEEIPNVYLTEEQRRNIFLIVKESCNNIARHAWCNSVIIDLILAGKQLEIKISDDGKGFDMEKVRTFANGLQNMQNRMQQIGGSYEIVSKPGHGTSTRLLIPV
jgi:signal transduction histidine kinase/ligand-binding sensor domain-containing protein